MQYKLLKELPLADIGDEVEYFETTTEIRRKGVVIAYLHKNFISEWLEEVKENKTIYDLKRGDEIWLIHGSDVIKHKAGTFAPYAHINCFLTEREAKRNNVLRKLATRSDKWLPEKGDLYFTYSFGDASDTCSWRNDNIDIMDYHMGLIFRDEEEYNKYMTDEVKDLLFNL